ncbi:MAG: SGNH/GDSL hydrolase family protein [Siphonobacter aquaeclarae]|jgi:acyl-CoA thioesterase-1|nr:SGNH/GDSL hydrolase family protein [Siphonobacter aquaeclarae]
MLLPLFLFLSISCSLHKNDPAPVPPVERPCFFQTKQTIVILGSSTAEGWGASTYDSSWAGRLKAFSKPSQVINLAKGGYVTTHILPTETPSAQVDTSRNIDAALRHHPTCIIISMTTNDIANGISVSKIMENLSTVVSYAKNHGVRYVFVTTPHPRKISAEKTAQYLEYRDRVLREYADFSVNYYDPIAGKDNLTKPELLKDGLHPNDKGHSVLFYQLLNAILRIRC